MRCFYRFLFLSPVTFFACGGETSTLLLAPPASEGGVGATEGGVSATEGGVVATDGGSGSTLACGPLTCKLPGEQCCVSPTQFFCIGVCADKFTVLKCASAANCGGGEVCCVSQNPLKSACMKACGNGDAMLCDPAATPAANRCANNVPCSTKNISDWGLPSTYGTCGGVGN